MWLFNLNFILQTEGVLKVTGNHVHFKRGIISETILDRVIVTTGHTGSGIRPI